MHLQKIVSYVFFGYYLLHCCYAVLCCVVTLQGDGLDSAGKHTTSTHRQTRHARAQSEYRRLTSNMLCYCSSLRASFFP